MINISADVTAREALAECLEVLRVGDADGLAGSQCVKALSKIGELCQQEGEDGDACRTAFGQVN